MSVQPLVMLGARLVCFPTLSLIRHRVTADQRPGCGADPTRSPRRGRMGFPSILPVLPDIVAGWSDGNVRECPEPAARASAPAARGFSQRTPVGAGAVPWPSGASPPADTSSPAVTSEAIPDELQHPPHLHGALEDPSVFSSSLARPGAFAGAARPRRPCRPGTPRGRAPSRPWNCPDERVQGGHIAVHSSVARRRVMSDSDSEP